MYLLKALCLHKTAYILVWQRMEEMGPETKCISKVHGYLHDDGRYSGREPGKGNGTVRRSALIQGKCHYERRVLVADSHRALQGSLI